jgi:hypothetical protein
MIIKTEKGECFKYAICPKGHKIIVENSFPFQRDSVSCHACSIKYHFKQKEEKLCIHDAIPFT